MSAYIPLIKTTKWIDLSSEHKKLRREIEQDTRKACVDKEQLQPIMLQGAFGIGKTNSLYYLFHYGWCVLETPTFLVSLDELTKTIKEFASTLPSGKIQNGQIGPFLNKILINQIDLLKGTNWSDIEQVYFPEFKGGDLIKYIEGFKAVEIIEDSNNGLKTFPVIFSEKVIKTAIGKNNRPLLLIDEFESKFYEFKKYIETSGGGVLRELFDQIVQDLNLFYLVIGNGPASGYEIAKERGDDSADSETAANRRLKTKPIPFPTANLLQRSFLKNDPKGYINFIWWLSRCRPGHILKLRDALGSLDEISVLNTNEIITKPIFKEPIDEGGEAVSYLKTVFFNEIPGRIQAAILGKLIPNFQPINFEIKEYKQDLKECAPYFYCATETINTEIDILPVLREDLYVSYLKSLEKDGKYDSVNYIEHIQPYFSFILNGISDDSGNIAFGMINDSKPDYIISKIFIIPLLELTYDFISLYQDDSIKETRETLDFLLNVINQINDSNERGELETFMPNTFDRFEKCKLLRNEHVFLQLSLYAIRESIEQPIGTPILKYKNEQISTCLNNFAGNVDLPIVYQKENNLHLYIIPDLPDDLLIKYLKKLETLLDGIFYDEIHKNGETIVRILYLSNNDLINNFKKKLLYNDESFKIPEPVFILKKIDVIDIDSYQLNFGSQIRDYIDSVSKIGMIGIVNGALSIADKKVNVSIIELKRVIDIIGDRPWTEKKETLRTIEHYRKLLLEGENSILKVILTISNQEYKSKLAENVCDEIKFKTNVNDYYYLDKILKDESEAYDKYSSQIALLYLIENSSIDDSLKQLLELAKNEYRFDIDKAHPAKAINFKTVLHILTKDKNNLSIHFSDFDINSSFISSLLSFSKMLLLENKLSDINDYYKYLQDRSESHFIRSYHKAMGGYFTFELTECLYNLSYLNTLDKTKIKASITSKVVELESSLAKVRVDIVAKLEELKTILDQEQNLSSYPEKLSKAIKGVALIKNILDTNVSYAGFLLINSIVEHFIKVALDSKTFFQQLATIYKEINVQKSKVDAVQEQIDILYSDPLTEKLLSFDYPQKRNEEYLWKKIFLAGNLKNKEEFEKIFGQSKSYFSPFISPIIYPELIKNFSQSLISVYNKVSPNLSELLNNMKGKQKLSENTKVLENYITELLTVAQE